MYANGFIIYENGVRIDREWQEDTSTIDRGRCRTHAENNPVPGDCTIFLQVIWRGRKFCLFLIFVDVSEHCPNFIPNQVEHGYSESKLEIQTYFHHDPILLP